VGTPSGTPLPRASGSAQPPQALPLSPIQLSTHKGVTVQYTPSAAWPLQVGTVVDPESMDWNVGPLLRDSLALGLSNDHNMILVVNAGHWFNRGSCSTSECHRQSATGTPWGQWLYPWVPPPCTSTSRMRQEPFPPYACAIPFDTGSYFLAPLPFCQRCRLS